MSPVLVRLAMSERSHEILLAIPLLVIAVSQGNRSTLNASISSRSNLLYNLRRRSELCVTGMADLKQYIFDFQTS